MTILFVVLIWRHLRKHTSFQSILLVIKVFLCFLLAKLDIERPVQKNILNVTGHKSANV